MPIHVSHSVVINRPIEKVFAYCGDTSNVPQWQDGVDESYQDGPSQLGAISTEVRHVMGQRMESQVQLIEYDPPYRLAFQVIKGPVPFEGVQTFEEVPGGTQVNFTLDGEPGGFFKIAAGMLQNSVQKDIERDFGNLKRILES